MEDAEVKRHYRRSITLEDALHNARTALSRIPKYLKKDHLELMDLVADVLESPEQDRREEAARRLRQWIKDRGYYD